MANHKGLPVLAFQSREYWDAWLNEHAVGSSGVWLKFAKKSSGIPSVGKPEAIETALAYGWIDGQLDGFDNQYWLVRFAPRGAKANGRGSTATLEKSSSPKGSWAVVAWLKLKRRRATGDGMQPMSLRAWPKLPKTLRRADKYPRAKAFFETLKGANRYSIVYRINDAKNANTRATRIEKFISMLELGQTVHRPAKPARK